MAKKKIYDDDLFRLLGRDHQPALDAIIERYSTELLAYIRAIIIDQELAKEILFDAYQKLWENRKSIAIMERPSAWLYKCARFQSLNTLKKEKRRIAIHIEQLSPSQVPGVIDNSIDIKELNREIQIAVSKLPPQMQLMYRMSREEGLSRKQIAERCHISESTVKNLLTESLKQIRKFMRAHIKLLLF